MKRDLLDLVQAYAGSVEMVEIYSAALNVAGIENRVVGTELSGSFGSTLPGSIELRVHRSDLSKAKVVIERESRLHGAEQPAPPHPHFPHPTDDPKAGPPPYRKEPYVNPDPGS